MQITVEFNPKSTARDVDKAIKLSESLNASKFTGTEKIVSVTQEVSNIHKDFLKVLEIVFRLARTKIFIDNELIEGTHHIHDLLTCVKKSYCNGICTLNTGLFHTLFQELGVISKEKFFLGITDWDVERLNIAAPEIFDLIRSDYAEVNRDKLIQAYIESCTNVYKACSVFSVDATVFELKKLPEVITVKITDLNSWEDEDDLDDEELSGDEEENHSTVNQGEFVITISPEQVGEIVTKVSDEIEIRLRKLLSEFK